MNSTENTDGYKILRVQQNKRFCNHLMASMDTIRRLLPLTLAARVPRQIAAVRVSEGFSRRLNWRYRRKKKPANVLSFRYGGEYGEILLCPALIRREAREQGHTYDYQLTWMIVHGMIHLGGVHHERSVAIARRVERLEQSTLKSLFGTRNPKSQATNYKQYPMPRFK